MDVGEAAPLRLKLSRPFRGSAKPIRLFLQRDGGNNLSHQFVAPDTDSCHFRELTIAAYTLSIEGDYRFAGGKSENVFGSLKPGENKTISLDVTVKE